MINNEITGRRCQILAQKSGVIRENVEPVILASPKLAETDSPVAVCPLFADDNIIRRLYPGTDIDAPGIAVFYGISNGGIAVRVVYLGIIQF